MTVKDSALCWTEAEEAIFEAIQRVSRLNRIQSIQFWKRMGSDGDKAVRYAMEFYPKYTEEQLVRFKKTGDRMRGRKRGQA